MGFERVRQNSPGFEKKIGMCICIRTKTIELNKIVFDTKIHFKIQILLTS